MKCKIVALLLSILAMLFIACASSIAPQTLLESKEPSTQSEVSTPPPWEEKWEKTLKAAGKEGKVMMYNTRSPELVQALREAFTKRYGIQMEAISGRGASLHEKIVMEYRAGVTGADVYFPGTTGLINVLKPAGVVDQ